eukprot:4993259-Pyramimonas_sp.AAC.1
MHAPSPVLTAHVASPNACGESSLRQSGPLDLSSEGNPRPIRSVILVQSGQSIGQSGPLDLSSQATLGQSGPLDLSSEGAGLAGSCTPKPVRWIRRDRETRF